MTKPITHKTRERYDDDEDREEREIVAPTPANRMFARDGYKDGKGPWRLWWMGYKLKRQFEFARESAQSTKKQATSKLVSA
jgi:hypothetical protein